LVPKSCESSDLELEQMVLRRVKIYGVYTAWVRETEGEDVVSCRPNGENDIVGSGLQNTVISDIVFPCESVDV
jgi:hypothetical protein